MFIETITQPEAEFLRWAQLLRTVEDPPAALAATIAWTNQDGTVTAVNVWDTPEAVGDHWLERVRPIIESEGEPANKPRRHGAPVHVYLRERVAP